MTSVPQIPAQNAGGRRFRPIRRVFDRLTPRLTEFVRAMDMAFITTVDATGECDCDLRPGLVQVLTATTLAYPHTGGNAPGEDGRLLIDFVTDTAGLHVRGVAGVVDDSVLRGEYPDLPVDNSPGGPSPKWVLVHVVQVGLVEVGAMAEVPASTT